MGLELLQIIITVSGYRQKKCLGRNQKLHHTLFGKCGLPDQQSRYKFPQTAGPSADSAPRDGV